MDFSGSQGRWSKEERIHTLTAGRLSVQEMQCLDQRAEDLLERARQRQTNELYAGWLEELECFAGAVGIGRALPASTKLVCRFLCFLEMTGSAAATGAAKSAISAWHSDRDLSDPCKANSVKQVLKGAARVAAESRRESKGHRRDPFPLEALRRWVAKCPKGVTRRRWIRDAAMVAVGLRLMLRPSELTGLRRGDIREKDGWFWVKIHKRKNDQLGQRGEDPIEPVRGEGVEAPLCPVRLLRMCLDEVTGPNESDPVFPSLTSGFLSKTIVNSSVKYMVSVTGIEDCVVAGHSLRVGGSCLGMSAGFTMSELRAIGGWESKAQRAYLRSLTCAQNGATARMGF